MVDPFKRFQIGDHIANLGLSLHELGGEPKILLPETERFLVGLEWPGNVRQLENTCRWITVMASGREIHLSDLPPELGKISAPATGCP